jgi:alpha-L-arabinofuranosidase
MKPPRPHVRRLPEFTFGDAPNGLFCMKSARIAAWILLLAAVFPLPAVAAPASLEILVNRPSARVSSNLFGIFFEEINFAGDGGLYAELIRNRSFAASTNAEFWSVVGPGTATGQMTVDESLPLNTNNLRSLKLTRSSGPGRWGAANSGYWGIPVQAGATYDLKFYCRGSNGFTGPINAHLENANGTTVYAQASFNSINGNWQLRGATLVSSLTDTNARLVLSTTGNGTFWVDEVSLFPRATYLGRTNGFRADISEKLAGLKPSFLRYPGGNFIESWNVTNAVRWKKTIGDLASRPGHLNDAWGYWSTDGYGLDEFFRQCEDLGCEPIYGINAGLMLGYNGSPHNTVPMAEMGPWVQDALDLIQYANGDTNTFWGALRAANGHPAPYGLKYLEIGNENGGTLLDERYTLFYDAIKAQYPDMRLIAPGNWSGGMPWSRPVDISDEHYYADPATFISYANKYDSYNRNGPKIFVGEYAVWSGFGTYGNLTAALAEATFMTGIERNSDIVEMACYAPLLANLNGTQWFPDLIYYDNHRSFSTPAYYVQQLFSVNRGNLVLPTTVTASGTVTNPPPRGAIGVGSWLTSVQYTNIVATGNGGVLYASDFVNQGTNGWRVHNGAWSVDNGLYVQSSAGATDCRSTTGNTNWSSYTISMRARKTGGSEGFLILFHWLDDNNWTWLNLGGWGNALHGIEQNRNGLKSILGTRVSGSIQNNQWYDISIVLSGSRIQCYLDGALIQDVNYPATSPSGLHVSSTYDEASGQVIVKAVNPYASPLETEFVLRGLDSISPNATLIRLTSGSAADENSFATPTKVSPVTNLLANAGTNFTLTIPGNSLSVLRLQAASVHFITNLAVQVPSPINSGETVSCTVLGQAAGSTNWINLTGDEAFTVTSEDPGIAGIDGNGNVTGIASGITRIIASYPALGLSATQTVEVVGNASALMHRYSFSETGGSTAADSIGGPPWNAVLPNGGAFGSGQLSLAGSGQQFVQFPAQILSNYTMVTLDSWVTFPSQLPVNCFYFGFGDSSGGSGWQYIFAAPRAGRIAITPGTWSSEQNATGAGDLSFRSNLHLTAVFNPPAGILALYTNGVLAALNSNVTVPMTSVNNVYGYIAKSLYSGDPYPDVILDEFRIYRGALSAGEIAASQAIGPDQMLLAAGVNLRVVPAAGAVTLAWPAAAGGFTLESRTNLASGTWAPVVAPPQIVADEWRVTLPDSGHEQYFRLRR